MSDFEIWEDNDEGRVDLGDGHWFAFFSWSPDRSCNPQYDGIPDIARCGITVGHRKPDGTKCLGAIHFDSPTYRLLVATMADADRARELAHLWTVHSFEPLTVSPSLLCRAENCGDHGFIRDGRWVRA